VSGDRIEIRGLSAVGYHGVGAQERLTGQPFSVDASVELDTAAAAASDDLADTVDYGGLVDELHRVLTGPPVALIETLADRLARVCLSRPGVRAVRITVHKPQAPVGHPVADLAVSIRRERG
jgi:dihydroneopterin aldolase